jgi:hypothetical protein
MNRSRLILAATAVLWLSLTGAALAADFFNPAVMPTQMSVGLGPEYDYTSRTLAIDSDGRVRFATNRALLDVTFNPVPYVGLRLRGGAGDMYFSQGSFGELNRSDRAKVEAAGVDGLAMPFNLVGGGGIEITVLRDPAKYVGLGLTGFGLYQMGSKNDFKASLTEYGAGLTVSWISLGTIVPYLGFDYTGVSGQLKATKNGQDYTFGLAGNPDQPIGVYAGLNVVLGDHTRINLEGRFLNELSGGVAVMYNF